MNLIFLVTIFLAGFVDGVVNVTYRDENFKTKHLNATIHTISLKPNEGTAINTKTAKSRLPRKYLRHSKSRDRKTFSTARKFMNRQLSNSCRYANDGECDEPSLFVHMERMKQIVKLLSNESALQPLIPQDVGKLTCLIFLVLVMNLLVIHV